MPPTPPPPPPATKPPVIGSIDNLTAAAAWLNRLVVTVAQLANRVNALDARIAALELRVHE